MIKEPNYSAPDRGRLNIDHSNLGAPEKKPSPEPKGVSRRDFLKGMLAAGVAVMAGKALDGLVTKEKKNPQLEKIISYLDDVQAKVNALSEEVDQADTASLSNEELNLLIKKKDLCATAQVQLGALRSDLENFPDKPQPEEVAEVRERFTALYQTLQELAIEAQEEPAETGKAIDQIINI